MNVKRHQKKYIRLLWHNGYLAYIARYPDGKVIKVDGDTWSEVGADAVKEAIRFLLERELARSVTEEEVAKAEKYLDSFPEFKDQIREQVEERFLNANEWQEDMFGVSLE
jgi:hypothetical protein